MRVLVVDDNGDTTASIATLLAECGHQVGMVPSGELALRKAPRFKPDVMFIGVVNSEPDGLTIARRLRDTPPFTSLPLVAVTDDSHLPQAVAEPFDDFVCKPYSTAHIKATLARIGAKLASSRERLNLSREMAARSEERNEESRRGLEEYWRRRQFEAAGELISVFVLGCDPTFPQFVRNQMPAGRRNILPFGSLEAFLADREAKRIAGSPCLVIDTTDQVDGPAVFSELAKREWTLPVVAFVALGDVPAAVQLMRLGACHVMEKPCDDRELLTAVWSIVAASARPSDNQSRPGFPVLSRDERRLLQLTVGGALTKQIARELGVSLRTVQLRRAALRKKLGARSASELIRLAIRGGLCQ